MANSTNKFDVAIVGAGLVGLSAAIALHQAGQSVVLVDAAAPSNSKDASKGRTSKKQSLRSSNAWDTRIYALTPATAHWLQGLGVWPLVDVARVNDVAAMALWGVDSGSTVELKAEEANLNKLACIAENKNLMQALWQQVRALDIPLMLGEICQGINDTEACITLHLASGREVVAQLLVAADGANSFVRQTLNISTKEKAFGQTALVANYAVEKAHSDVARQWFSPHNTLALLPLPDQQVSMVWSVPDTQADALLSLSDEALSERVQTQSQSELGTLQAVSKALSFTLKQSTASKLIAPRTVFIGDAAHQIHPMAGQGANLGFRDVMGLQAIIAGSHHLQDIGETGLLRQYERSRKADVASMNILTSGLDYLFASEHGAIKQMAGWGMKQLNKHASIKQILIKQAVA